MTWLFLLLSFASAGFLQMESKPQIEIKKIESGYAIQGMYQIQNLGNDIAMKVTPDFSFNDFHWQGEVRSLQPGESYQWKIDEKLQGPPNGLKGEYLIYIKKHYEDLNGYHFEIPEILPLAIESRAKAILPFELQTLPLGYKKFRAIFRITNSTAKEIKVRLKPHLPGEVVLLTQLNPLIIQPNEPVQGSFEFQNERGLPGSQYVAFLGAEWESAEQNQAQFSFAGFSIPVPGPGGSEILSNPSDRKFLFWWLWSLGFGLIILWIVWFRPLKKLQK